MKAVILAGGRGTRLGSVTREIPKPMVTVGGKPILHHLVDLLVKSGLNEIIILVNFLKDPIMEYFRDGASFGARISYYEESVPLGTVGGIKEIEARFREDFMVLYGDVMMDMDLSRFIRFHREKASQCTLVLHPNDHPYDSDLVETNIAGRVVAFHSKPHDPATWYHNMVNAGAYIISPVVLSFLEKGKKADFGRDIFPALYDKIAMYGYQTSEYLKDMGTPGRLESVREDYIRGIIRRRNYELPQQAVFLDRDGVLNVERSYISTPDEFELYSFAPAAVHRINQAGLISVVVTNQSAIARNLCTEEDVRTIHRKMETLLGKEHAWIDAVYYCPHHPDKGFPEENKAYKIECDCRKPKTALFSQAIEKFNISPSASYMIGDSERDIQAGINAGLMTIGVRTGYGIKKTRVLPDFMFSNLAEAVDFIVDNPFGSVLDTVQERFRNYKGGSPWILLIGGNTRSGKSTLASFLRLAFVKSGFQVLHVELDNWLVPESLRTKEMNVYERFSLPQVESDLGRLLRGESLVLSRYRNHPDSLSIPVEYNPSGTDIIIVDGVVALSSPWLRDRSHLKLFTTVPRATFEERIIEYYSWRGKTVREIETLVQKRKRDEYQLIEKESKFADLIINPAAS